MTGITVNRPGLHQNLSASSAHNSSGHSHGNLFGRLQALFPASQGGPGSPTTLNDTLDTSYQNGGMSGMYRARTEPTQSAHEEEVKQTDREAIKVLIVTWNMGDALPKGDLTVLLGQIPSYQPETSSPSEFPHLPIEYAHPYHIVVIAGQECPTPSGVPRGLGGGLLKGVVTKKEDKEKDKDKEKEKKGHLDENGINMDHPVKSDDLKRTSPAIPLYMGDDRPFSDSSSDSEDGALADTGSYRSQPASPVHPHSPMHHKHNTKTKGWSTILDEWLCGLPARQEGLQSPPGNNNNAPDSPSTTYSPFSHLSPPQAPNIIRASSAPIPSSSLQTSKPLPIPNGPLSPHTGHVAMARSPLSRSQSSDEIVSSPEKEYATLSPDPTQDSIIPTKSLSTPIKIKHDKSDMGEDTAVGSGPYLHVVKERLLGMYLTVYVYKGCESFVQGVDKDVVTAGLAGGRLGNKGGIGISLKLADHRFLFVNSHLAAHTGRNSARMANIAKIKNELKLDCFLPKEDPRSLEPDLTDRFDTVFWCGDLNFRLDITRLHADWLIEKKNYAEALKFDQLRMAMANSSTNPLPGFQEGVIDFAPTFKYDVWKSVKATNRDARRSLRRRKTLEGKAKGSNADGPRSLPVQATLPHVPEAQSGEDLPILAEAEGDSALDETVDDDPQTDTTTLDERRRSIDSGYTSAAQSYYDTATDVDDDLAEARYHATLAANSKHHRGSIEHVIKEKGKRLLSVLKIDGMLNPTHEKRRGNDKERKRKPSSTVPENEIARRTSSSSMRSMRTESPVESNGRVSVASSYTSNHISQSASFQPSSYQSNNSNDANRRPSAASRGGSPPRQPPLVRRFSALKRSVSGRVVKYDPENLSSEGQDGNPEDWDGKVDNRAGVYDSSKKQRVPSWCDRVLWKSHVEPDPLVPDDISVPSEHRENAFLRISHVFSNLGHLRNNVPRRSVTIENPWSEKIRQEHPLLNTASPSPTKLVMLPTSGIVNSPVNSPLSLPLHPGETGSVPAPKSTSSQSSRTTTLVTRHQLTDSDSVSHGKPAKPIITFNLGEDIDVDREKKSGFGGSCRRRANSLTVLTEGDRPNIKSSPSFPPRINSLVNDDDEGQSFLSRRGSLGTTRSSRKDSVVSSINSNRSPTQRENSHTSSIRDRERDRERERERDHPSSSFSKFIKDIPNILHGRGSTIFVNSHDSDVAGTGPGNGSVMPKFKRRLKGEVVCLHYGTIDDTGMRKLEGRSDHRPAIFAGAVYI